MITILDFYAKWCVPCKKLNPIIDNLKITYPNIIFTKIDIEKEHELTDKYKIDSVPTIIILDHNNQIISKIVGLNIQLLTTEIQKVAY